METHWLNFQHAIKRALDKKNYRAGWVIGTFEKRAADFPTFGDYASINVKPEGGDPGHMWGIWLFRRIFGQNPHRGAPKLGQIRSNIPTFSINLYWKWVTRSSVFV